MTRLFPSGLPRGCTYAMASTPYDGWAKIGRSGGDKADRRLIACQIGNPRTLELRALWTLDVESKLHQIYKQFRGRGEWFALPQPMLSDMEALALEERPDVMLAIEWPTERIWGLAGVEPGGATPEQLARLFMAPDDVVQLAARPRTAHGSGLTLIGKRNA